MDKIEPSPAQRLLRPFRDEIDAVDNQIIALLGQRFDIIRRVARLKAEHGIAPILPDRIEEVVAHARQDAARAGFNPDVAEQIYRLLINAAVEVETDFIDSNKAEGV